jgi:hypothetical protein
VGDTAGRASFRDRLGWLAKLTFSVAVLGIVVHRVDAESMGEALSRVRAGLLLIAIGLYVMGQLLSASKWGLVAAVLGLRRPWGEYARFYFIGMFVNLLGPSTVGGDLTRALSLGGTGQRTVAVHSVVFDRVSGLVVLVVIGLVGLLAFPRYPLPRALGMLSAGVLAALLFSWWIVPRAAALVFPTGHRLRTLIQEELAPLWKDRRLLVTVGAISATFHVIEVTIQYVLTRALGLEVPFSYCLIFHPAVAVLSAVPVTVAGLGVREGGYVFFLGLIGVPGGAAFTAGVLWFAVRVVGALPGALLLFQRDTRGHVPRTSAHKAVIPSQLEEPP